MKNQYALCFLILVFLQSCGGAGLYEQNKEIPATGWAVDSIATFKFSVEDTTQKYNIFYNVRNQVAYPYYNLYVTFYLYNDKDSLLASNLHEMNLANPTTGEPYGSGLGDVRDHQFLGLPNCRFKQKGTYTFKIKQYMRQNPLKNIEAIGIKVAEAE